MGRLPRISTERLSLRPFTIMDIDRLHALWTQPDMRGFLWDDIVISRDRAADEVELGLENAGRYGIGYWIIESQKETELLGFCGFRLIDRGPEIELMYGFGTRIMGQRVGDRSFAGHARVALGVHRVSACICKNGSSKYKVHRRDAAARHAVRFLLANPDQLRSR